MTDSVCNSPNVTLSVHVVEALFVCVSRGGKKLRRDIWRTAVETESLESVRKAWDVDVACLQRVSVDY